MWSKCNCLYTGHRPCAFPSPHCSLSSLSLFNGTHTWKGVELGSGIVRVLFACLVLYNVVINKKMYPIVILSNDILKCLNAHLGSNSQCCSLWKHCRPQACNPLFRDLNVNITVFTTEFNSHDDSVLCGWSECLIGLFPFLHIIQSSFGGSSWRSLIYWCSLTRLMIDKIGDSAAVLEDDLIEVVVQVTDE